MCVKIVRKSRPRVSSFTRLRSPDKSIGAEAAGGSGSCVWGGNRCCRVASFDFTARPEKREFHAGSSSARRIHRFWALTKHFEQRADGLRVGQNETRPGGSRPDVYRPVAARNSLEQILICAIVAHGQ
jgi:hypothetical protein